VSAPAARVVHRTTARTRLRTRGMKGNAEYFAQIQSALLGMNGVRAVMCNPLTESILLEHDVPVDPLLREAEERGFLQLDATVAEQRTPYLKRLGHALLETDEKVHTATNGRVDLETLTFFGMLAGGIYQVTHGHALPAGVTLLRYAVEIVTSSVAATVGAEVAKQIRLEDETSTGE
jgi:Heavy metal associated domain 2